MRLALLGCCLGVLAAGDEPGWRDPAATLAVGLTRAALDAAISVPPGTWWNDPEARAVRDHVVAQLRRAQADAALLPPLVELAEHGAWALLEGFAPAVPPPGVPRQDELLLHADTGAAAPAWRAWIDREFAGTPPRSLGGIAGGGPPGLFLGLRDARFIAGPDALVERRGPATPSAAPALRAAADLRPLLRDLAPIIAGDPVWQELLAAAPAWRAWQPRVDAEAGVGPQGWRGTLRLTGTPGLPLRRLDPGISALARSDRALTVAVGADPALVARLVIGAIAAVQGPFHARRALLGIEAVAGAPLPALAALTTGDVLVQVGAEVGPLPAGALVIKLADPARVGALLPAVAAGQGWTPTTVVGAEQAFTWMTPVGAVLIARSADRLVAGNDAVLVAAWCQGAAGDAALPAGAALHLGFDARRLGPWLSVGLALLAQIDQPLGDDPLRGLDAAIAIGARSAVVGNVSARLLGPRPLPWVRRLVDNLASDGDGAALLDRGAALYERDLPGRRELRLVLRTASGFLLVGERERPLLDAAGVAARLAGWRQTAGPPAALLPVLTLPERARVDRRWLPPLAVVQRHLPTWRLALWAEADGVGGEEHGLPGATVALAALGWTWWWQHRDLESLRIAAMRHQAEHGVRARHGGALASVEAAAAAVRALRAAGKALPPLFSGLAGDGGLALADSAGLFAGRAPLVAADLDRAGRWDPRAANPQGALWALRLDERWAALIDPAGQVQLTSDLRGVPGVAPLPPVGPGKDEVL